MARLILFLLIAALSWSQGSSNTAYRVTRGATDPVTCSVGDVFFNTTIGITKVCSLVNTWRSSPVWGSYTYTKIANTVNGCANAKGCWQLNGAAGAGTTPAADVTQPLTLLALPANGVVDDVRIKTAVACVNGGGTATITSVGLTGEIDYYATAFVYDLEAPVGNANLLWPAMAARGSDTDAGTNVTVTLRADAGNIEDWTNGCSFTVHLKWGVLP